MGAPGSWVRLQAPAPPVGLVELRICPSLPTATQSPVVGQETPRSSRPSKSCVRFQAPAPAVGVVEVSTLPLPPTATQRSDDGQETPCIWVLAPLGLRSATAQAPAPPLGLVVV